MDCAENHIETNLQGVLRLQNISEASQTRFKIWTLLSSYEHQIYFPCMLRVQLLAYIWHKYRPELHAPPQAFTPEGEVVKPVPEKSFIQKYWIYIAALFLILRTSVLRFSPFLSSIFIPSTVVGGGSDEEQPRRAQWTQAMYKSQYTFFQQSRIIYIQYYVDSFYCAQSWLVQSLCISFLKGSSVNSRAEQGNPMLNFSNTVGCKIPRLPTLRSPWIFAPRCAGGER